MGCYRPRWWWWWWRWWRRSRSVGPRLLTRRCGDSGHAPRHPPPRAQLYRSTIPCQAMPYNTTPYHTIPYHTIPYHTIQHHPFPLILSIVLQISASHLPLLYMIYQLYSPVGWSAVGRSLSSFMKVGNQTYHSHTKTNTKNMTKTNANCLKNIWEILYLEPKFRFRDLYCLICMCWGLETIEWNPAQEEQSVEGSVPITLGESGRYWGADSNISKWWFCSQLCWLAEWCWFCCTCF